MYKWPLNVDDKNVLDRLKLAYFMLTSNQYTQSKLVAQYEKKWAEIVGSPFAVMTSSGSTANSMAAACLAHEEREQTGLNRKYVVFPVVNWTTSVAPYIEHGFTPLFLDVDSNTFQVSYLDLDNILKNYAGQVAAVCLTSILGFTPSIYLCDHICDRYDVRLIMDNCEDAFGRAPNGRHCSSYHDSTLSTYFGHQINSVEGGMIFTNNIDRYIYYLMYRNHGMVRSLENNELIHSSIIANKKNDAVDSRFSFDILGSNFRNTDINAYVGLLSLNKYDKKLEHRKNIWHYYCKKMHDVLKFEHTDRIIADYVPFALPLYLNIPFKEAAPHLINNSIECRPLLSGNLLYHKAYEKYRGVQINASFEEADIIHTYRGYVGLHDKVTKADIDKLIDILKGL